MYTYMYKNIFIIYKYLYPLLLGAKTRTVALVIFFCVYVPNNYFFREILSGHLEMAYIVPY